MKTKTVTLSSTARSAIVSTFVSAISSAENSGSLVTQVCDAANKYARGEQIAESDISAIGSAVAKERGWKGRSLKSRLSEVRVVLRSYATLPEAIEAFIAKAKSCDWHTSMKLARRLNKGDSVKQAVAAAFEKNGQSKKSTPQGRTAAGLKAWYKVARPDKQKLILQVADMLGLRLGVKV